METELDALHKNNTWVVTPLPKDKRAIGCRWIYKLKLKDDGLVDKYKARLVAKGYNQIEGIDYIDSFPLVAKAVTFRILLAVVASKNELLHHVDVNNAFLHGFLEEDIYMQPPEGYQVPEGNSSVTGFVVLLVYVDDILIAGDSTAAVQEVKTYLNDLFTTKVLRVAKYYLGLEIARSNEGVVVTQTKYIRDLLLDTGMTQSKTASTPLFTGISFQLKQGNCCLILKLIDS
ncbi:UNVERIFIED_CONTAM: Retrovirus-related Pol polyprotein from transposon RE2 [Sesamum latifolium]|uniref:Retrovirus-related Pol polyprotein from transposon RE2 n=1 Tax=Sesamum latifolium TaxID=2727402 RepID=A0AAW2V108_9LAMI